MPGLMYHVKDYTFGPQGPLAGLRKKGTLSDLHFMRLYRREQIKGRSDIDAGRLIKKLLSEPLYMFVQQL